MHSFTFQPCSANTISILNVNAFLLSFIKRENMCVKWSKEWVTDPQKSVTAAHGVNFLPRSLTSDSPAVSHSPSSGQPCRTGCPIYWGFRLKRAPAESPIPVAFHLHSLIHCARDTPRICLAPNTGEKRLGSTEICLSVQLLALTENYCNAPSSFLSSPGSLSKPVELLWSSTSVSLRRIKWSTMRG